MNERDFDQEIVANREKILKVFSSGFDLTAKDLVIEPKSIPPRIDFIFRRFGKTKPLFYSFMVGDSQYFVQLDDEYVDEEYNTRAEYWLKNREVYLLLESIFSAAWMKRQ